MSAERSLFPAGAPHPAPDPMTRERWLYLRSHLRHSFPEWAVELDFLFAECVRLRQERQDWQDWARGVRGLIEDSGEVTVDRDGAAMWLLLRKRVETIDEASHGSEAEDMTVER